MGNLVLLLPFLLQGLAMVVDEFYYHRGRGLPRWERIGHPLDTLTVTAAFGFLAFFPPGITNLWVFVALSAFSCLFVTKDEFVHLGKCKPGEQWLHSILFILHPVVFLSAGFLWWQGNSGVLLGQAAVIFAFGLYQLGYWLLYRRDYALGE